MSLRVFKLGRADTFLSRVERARDEGYSRGFMEGGLFKLAVGGSFNRAQVLDWLDNVIEEGREELNNQHASEREVEAWDMSCRIAFLLEIASSR
jgi:hypothetical protein